jgi:hypothetical protein
VIQDRNLVTEAALVPVHPVPDRDLALGLALEGALVAALVAALGEGPDAALAGDLDRDLSVRPVPLAWVALHPTNSAIAAYL